MELTVTADDKHGCRIGGGTFEGCTCSRQACGGIAARDMREDCPWHAIGGPTPALSWHWPDYCPSRSGSLR